MRSALLIVVLVVHACAVVEADAAQNYPALNVLPRSEYFQKYDPYVLEPAARIVLRISPQAIPAMRALKDFQFRIFRGTREELQPAPYNPIKDCVIFISQEIVRLDPARIDAQGRWEFARPSIYWLAYDTERRIPVEQAYTIVLEREVSDRRFVVLESDKVKTYFDAGFQITIPTPHTVLSQKELAAVDAYWKAGIAAGEKELKAAQAPKLCRSVLLDKVLKADGSEALELVDLGECSAELAPAYFAEE
jgi:hypothetical protein